MEHTLCPVAGSPASAEEMLDGVLCLPEVPQRQYRLSPNPEENQQLHSEFYYEQVHACLHLSVCIPDFLSDYLMLMKLCVA